MIAYLTPVYLLYRQVRIQVNSKSENISVGVGTVFSNPPVASEGCMLLSLSRFAEARAEGSRVLV